MRLFTSAALLAFASSAIAQTQLAEVTTPTSTSVAQTSVAQTSAGQTSIAQQARHAPRPGTTSSSGATAGTVVPNTPVVTLEGICAQTRATETKAKDACQTVITREDLDKFMSATMPGASEAARAGMAVQYAGALAFSNLAEKEGLEQNPMLAKELDEQIKLLRMRFFAGAFLQTVQRRTPGITEAEIQRYYDLHRDKYEVVKVIRLSIPVEAPTESGRPPERSAVKSEMEQLRTRALAGGDLAQLHQDAFSHLHIQATPPPIRVLTLRRSDVQGEEIKAFELKPGEISAVLDLPASFAILKLDSREDVPIAAIRQEIGAALMQERMQAAVHSLAKDINAQFNLQYLGLTSQPDIFAVTTPSPVNNRASQRRTASSRVGTDSSHWASR